MSNNDYKTSPYGPGPFWGFWFVVAVVLVFIVT